MDVKISELIALACVFLYAIITVLPDIWRSISGKSEGK